MEIVKEIGKIAARERVVEESVFFRAESGEEEGQSRDYPAEVFAVPLVGKRCKLKERSNLKGLASLDDRRLRCEPST